MLTDTEQAAHALADFCQSEGLPDAAEVCARAAGLLAARHRGDIGNQEYAQQVQTLAAQVARHSGAVDDHRTSQH